MRGGFDGLIRTASQNFNRVGVEYRPPSELLTYWDLILHIARCTRDPFPPLVDGNISAALCREATLASNARAAASPHPPPPLEPDPFAPLRTLVVSYRLKGNEKDTVLAICDGSGGAPLGNLALRFEWQHPATDWNALRGRLNKKFKKTDWHFYTHDNEARVQRRKGTERK